MLHTYVAPGGGTRVPPARTLLQHALVAPKPAFSADQSLLQLLPSTRYVVSIAPAGNERGHCFFRYPAEPPWNYLPSPHKQTPTAAPRRRMAKIAALLLLGCDVLFLSAPQGVQAGTGGLSLGVNHAPCVRLFHSGGDVGCRTPGREGVAGPLLLVDSDKVLHDIEVTRRSDSCLPLLTHRRSFAKAW